MYCMTSTDYMWLFLRVNVDFLDTMALLSSFIILCDYGKSNFHYLLQLYLVNTSPYRYHSEINHGLPWVTTV